MAKSKLTLTQKGWKSYTWEQQEKICEKYDIIFEEYLTRNEKIKLGLSGVAQKVRGSDEKRAERRAKLIAGIKKWRASSKKRRNGKSLQQVMNQLLGPGPGRRAPAPQRRRRSRRRRTYVEPDDRPPLFSSETESSGRMFSSGRPSLF